MRASLARRCSLKNNPRRVLAGVDGCRGGWIAVISAGDKLQARVMRDWKSLVSSLPARSILGVDIPIGLPRRGARLCDIEARRILGRPRGSSIFPAPARGVLMLPGSHQRVSRQHRRIDGRGLSQQAYRLIPKIQELDEYLEENLPGPHSIFEIHPEVSFCVWNGSRPMAHRKSTSAGRQERERMISRVWPGENERLWGTLRGQGCARDDLNDAFAALWTVGRIVEGTAQRLPSEPEPDETGLLMIITV